MRPQETLPIIHDFGGGAPCGGYVYDDDGLPETYRGRIFHCEWGQGKVWAVKVAPDGAGFKYVDQIAFMDPVGVKDFRPFSIRPTADGRGFYVTDWGFSGWLQNKKVGRIYKVTYVKDDVKPAPRGSDKDSIADLIKALDHPAYTERLRAQRALQARGKEAAEPLQTSWKNGKLSKRGVAARGLGHGQGLAGKPGTRWSSARSRDADAGVRLEAVRAIGRRPPVVKSNEFGGILSNAPIQARSASSWPRTTPIRRCDCTPPPSSRIRRHGGRPSAVARRGEEITSCGSPWFERSNEPPTGTSSANRTRWRKSPRSPRTARPSTASSGRWPTNTTLGAVAILTKLANHDDPAVRQKAVADLARVYRDRKPYAGGWWGTQPAAHDPPPREVDWEGTPAVREAVLAALVRQGRRRPQGGESRPAGRQRPGHAGTAGETIRLRKGCRYAGRPAAGRGRSGVAEGGRLPDGRL